MTINIPSINVCVEVLLNVFPLISAVPQISAAPLSIHIEISAAPLNMALIILLVAKLKCIWN